MSTTTLGGTLRLARTGVRLQEDAQTTWFTRARCRGVSSRTRTRQHCAELASDALNWIDVYLRAIFGLGQAAE